MNKKYLITSGCSYTSGALDQYGWPDYLAKLMDRELDNKAEGGRGNYYISNQVYDIIDTSKYNWANSIVIVMWSGIDRVDKAVSKKEFNYFDKFNDNIQDSWLHSGGAKGFDKTKTKDRYWYNYYKTYHTEEDSYIQTLQHMIGVQEFLTNRKIPYLFLTYKDIFSNRYQKYKRAKNLENHINWDRFHFPNGEFGGEFEWVKDNNLTWSEDGIHPSEESHKKYAEYLHNLKLI
jgi:hypothetical protein